MLVLLIVSVGVHFALTGLGLVFFGAEGFRNPSFWDARFSAGALTLSGQTIIIFVASIVADRRRCGSSSSARCAARRCARPRSTGSARG